MIRRLLEQRVTVVGLALILAVNVVAGIGIVYNRRGSPDSVLSLNQRELRLPATVLSPSGSPDTSGVALRIDWQVLPELGPDAARKLQYADSANLPPGAPRLAGWLDRNKLESLGYRFPEPAPIDEIRRSRPSELAREVYLVLEFDGPAYRESVERAVHDQALVKAALEQKPGDPQLAELRNRVERNLTHARLSASRLFAIDAGLDLGALRERYADRSRFAIVRGKVRPLFRPGPDQRPAGTIEALTVAAINVPLRLKRVFEPPRGVAMDRSKAWALLAYNVDLAIGRRLEPWILAAEPAATAQGS
jgi:hypothetical protein